MNKKWALSVVGIFLFSQLVLSQNFANPVYTKEGLINPKKRDKDAVIVPEEKIDPEKQKKEFLAQMEENKEAIEEKNKQFLKKKHKPKLAKKVKGEKLPVEGKPQLPKK